MMVVAIIVGLPVFFEVGFVLLIPIAFNVAKRTNKSLLLVGLPMVAGLSVVHGLIPPHPAAMLAVQAYHADIGKTIAYGLMVGVPTAIVAGPLFALLISRYIKLPENNPLAAQFLGHGDDAQNNTKSAAPKRELPSFGVTLFTILLPVILMLIGSWADLVSTPKTLPNDLLHFVGNSDVALLIAVLVSFWTFGASRGFNREQIQKFCGECLAPIAGITLIVGAGGGFGRVLMDSGISKEIVAVAIGHASVAAAVRLAGGRADSPGHGFGDGRHDHRLRHRRADRSRQRRAGHAGIAGARHRFGLADFLARERRRFLADQGILRYDGGADLQDMVAPRNHHFTDGLGFDFRARDGRVRSFR